MGDFGCFELALILVGLLVGLLPFLFAWEICKRLGLSRWLILLNLLPGGTVVFLGVLAWIEWPPPNDKRPL